MSTKFGWCLDNKHHLCIKHSGGLECGCPCHHREKKQK